MKRASYAVLLVILALAVFLGGAVWGAAAPKGKAPPPKTEPPKTEQPKAEEPKNDDSVKLSAQEVNEAIEKGRQYLIGLAGGDGSFRGAEDQGGPGGISALVFMTLAYMGEHPNKPYMEKGLDYLMNLGADTGFGTRPGYAVPIRVMGFSYVYGKLLVDKKTLVRQKMQEDVLRMNIGQANNGGWRYKLAGGADQDFSVSQWPILAMREGNLVGVEINTDVLKRARKLYLDSQNPDGGWHYQKGKSYGSMTAAGLASLFIIADLLEPMSGCPCRNGKSGEREAVTEKAIDKALDWLSHHYSGANPEAETTPGHGKDLYWLYCAERVGIAAGYKYFGPHNWYKEGAKSILGRRQGDHWDSVHDTCFSLLFLYKGQAGILFNKLMFNGADGKAGEWNSHRRDIANLTDFIGHKKEEHFQWQITDLRASVEELHDAPILYISAESLPNFTDADKKKLRAFTDTGGTIFFEASCGNAAVRKWFADFAKEVWPEWPLKPITADHGVFTEPHPLKQKPELFGIDDGMRTFLFYAMDDISCMWQTKALTTKDYLFLFGINLFTYATDRSPLRSKVGEHAASAAAGRYKDPVKAGPRTTIKVARVRYAGNWEANLNYGGLHALAERIKSRSGVTLEVKEPTQQPFNVGGVSPGELSGYDVAYIAGSGAISLKPDEKEALKAYVAKGGFLWLENATGGSAFDQTVQALMPQMGWKMQLLPNTHPLITGRMDPATGYNLTTGVEFRQVLRISRLARRYAEFYGIFAGDKLVGVYSPFDVTFSSTPYDAFKVKGYKTEDATAVATNLALYLSTLQP